MYIVSYYSINIIYEFQDTQLKILLKIFFYNFYIDFLRRFYFFNSVLKNVNLHKNPTNKFLKSQERFVNQEIKLPRTWIRKTNANFNL